MKFSLQLLNEFIELKNIKLHQFQEILILCGLEINQTNINQRIENVTLSLELTSNRREISSVINLVKEINIILNLPLKIKIIDFQHKLHSKRYYKKTEKVKLLNNVFYLKLHQMNNIQYDESPKWLKAYLKVCDINDINIFIDVKEYIKLKWGHKIHICNINNLESDLIRLKLINKYSNNYFQYNLKNQIKKYKNQSQILIFIIYQNKTTTEYNYIDYFYNAYNETINIITTYTKCTISKSNILDNNINKLENKSQIKIDKNQIKNILGPIIKKKLRFISMNNIYKILYQLNFKPIYYKKYKTFITHIPYSRVHDLKRSIDIIEEIGRIHGLQYFFDSIPIYMNKGNLNKISLYIKKTRYILRNLGLNEVVNCSLVNKKNQKQITLHNPIAQEQQALRESLIENLIDNYENNIKYKNFPIEIFEIGKIFTSDNNNNYIEKIHLAGLIYNENFIKMEWSRKSKKINLFHVKGIIEVFLEQINSKVIWKKIQKKNKNYSKSIENIIDLLKTNKTIGLYNESSQKIIGTLGELNINKNKVYIFEINLEELYLNNIQNKHLDYIIKPYSPYPSVIRDISIKIDKEYNIDKIKNIILNTNIQLIESIDILNQYYDKLSKLRNLGLRITYRAMNRTLNNNDIKNINDNIKNLLDNLKN
uniref:phenylalanine--tRNA ligase n=1 Tax=Sonderella linearis TaxID=110477 RepID=A0A1Z1MMG6_9FLOR|nr:Phenylalanine-tRNA ligase beta subunit [Sonderella linearis]ARW67126.1 Phenylalanine-tRNA ligase beta subunit [Sonderella linearis]